MHDEEACTIGTDRFMAEYLANETRSCSGAAVTPAAAAQCWYADRQTIFYSNFVGGWLGLLASPELLCFSRLWYDYQPGIWAHRWGDQQYWCNALGLVTYGPQDWVSLQDLRDRIFCHARARFPKSTVDRMRRARTAAS
jgi:hypothetical protein